MSGTEDREPPHRIRLRGPWEAAWLDAAGVAGPFVRFPFPGVWRELPGSPSERARLRRRFARPSNLEPAERVWLVCEALPPEAEVRLDGLPLEPRAARWDVTDRLRGSHLLEIELPAGAPDGPILPGEVRIEIEAR